MIRIVTFATCVWTAIHSAKSTKLDLLSGDVRRELNPSVFKKHSHHAPVFINIHPTVPKPHVAVLLPSETTKLPVKLPILDKTKVPPILLTSRVQTLNRIPKFPQNLLYSPQKLPTSIPTLLLPKILYLHLLLSPKRRLLSPLSLPSPVLPSTFPLFLLPLKPSLLPKLPLPKLRKKSKLLPLKKTQPQSMLASEIKPVKVNIFSESKSDGIVFKRLLELRRKGSITTPEFIRFMRLLFKVTHA
ncbi:hypothetical protein EVAR_35883_1 [Eumeta japonica]|uniref:Uncharacterized protein n=1 Tax=Eumeta variegata TaxID=151549 RepID=A0A4C1WTL0_EUMVA|nr:hypothetical protein EVAR_35883_1 [Eumeta japonica]